MCHVGDVSRQYEHMKFLDATLYQNQHIVFKEYYRLTFCLCESCIGKEDCTVEERGILGKLINYDRYCSESYRPYQKRKSHRGLTNGNNAETVLLSDLKQLFEHVKEEMNNYKYDISKKLIENCRTVFKDNTASLFRKSGTQGLYALLSLLQNENQHETIHIRMKKSCCKIWIYRRWLLLFM